MIFIKDYEEAIDSRVLNAKKSRNDSSRKFYELAVAL